MRQRRHRGLRLAEAVFADRVALLGIGLALLTGLMANGALHAGNYRQALDGSTSTALGIVTAAQALGIVMAAPLLALLTAERRSANLSITAGALAGIGFLSVFLTPAFAIELVGRFVLGCGVGLAMAFSEYLVISRAPRHIRPIRAMIFGVLLAAGHAAGTLLTGLPQLIPVLVVLSALTIGLSLLLAPQDILPQQHQSAGFSDLTSVIRLNPSIFLAALLFGFMDNGFLTLLPDYFVAGGLDRSEVILTSFAAFAGICACQIPAGVLSMRFEPFTVLRMTVLLLIGGVMMLMLLMNNPMARLPLAFGLGGLVDVIYTVGLVSLAASMPRHRMAAANACFVSFCGLGEVTGPLATGPALDHMGLSGGVLIIIALLAGFWIGSARMVPRAETRLAPR